MKLYKIDVVDDIEQDGEAIDMMVEKDVRKRIVVTFMSEVTFEPGIQLIVDPVHLIVEVKNEPDVSIGN